jgi:hypothetical protein
MATEKARREPERSHARRELPARLVMLDADELAVLESIEQQQQHRAGRDEPVCQAAEPVGGFVW